MIIHKHFEVEETAVTIICDEEYVSSIQNSIFDSREIIKQCIMDFPEFQWSLEPLEVSGEEIIIKMCKAAKKAGVGPMAAVAGAIAEKAVQTAMDEGSRHCIVENGGDIAMVLEKPVNIGIFAPALKDVGFHIDPVNQILGMCTSSASIGPSISFGVSDASVVISNDVCLADACATRLGNLVTSDEEDVIKKAMDIVCSIDGVDGAFVAVNSKIAMKGVLPQLCRVRFDESSITKIEF
ncbi:hypothetical protein A3206_02620 [Candidatus Methanomassiliicoccus intestinalis]|jgi:UPF0280 protein UNCMA_16740|uniref:Uncharacterized protein n=2 Tax=Candidatus Methanomassiliicoccus intestinalis TaxID=1406512 RepID=R9TBG2_METII|nr:UPF0280 family protein [Candidatus Methanomassiliicoccus intestinalis]AGN26768.1 hypothetical protein MMINT_14500 [Candidatus Methanomassiliicoccus intestinalis Issoire-Mx1]TQS83743.1 MAG: hypothetical protein A3206_02620 [Candidatus Methanomassiliicoccus intestinalis]